MEKQIFIRSNEQIVEEFPAYVVVDRAPNPLTGAIEISVNDILGVARRGYYGQYKAGSVASYALQYNECPLEAVANAKARGHNLYWINQQAVAITAWKQPQVKIVAVKPGQRVYFQGKFFELVKEPNDNIGLKSLEIVVEQVAA